MVSRGSSRVEVLRAEHEAGKHAVVRDDSCAMCKRTADNAYAQAFGFGSYADYLDAGADLQAVPTASTETGAVDPAPDGHGEAGLIIPSPGQPAGTAVEVVVNPLKETDEEIVTEGRDIADVVPGNSVITYEKTQTRRKGQIRHIGQMVSSVTSFWYDGRLVRVASASGETSAYIEKHRCIVRFGTGLLGKFAVYLMRNGNRYRVAMTHCMQVSNERLTFYVLDRANDMGADAVWVLSVHETRPQALLAERVIQHTLNIPVDDATVTGREKPDKGVFVKGDTYWDRQGKSREAAERCLREHGLLINYPLWSADVNPGLVSTKTDLVTAAVNIFDGMLVLPFRNVLEEDREVQQNRWEEVSVTYEGYTGLVFSLGMKKYHTYFGDGILTHTG